MEEAILQEIPQGAGEPPKVTVYPNDFTAPLGKVFTKTIEAVPAIEKVEKKEDEKSILEQGHLRLDASKLRTNVVVFSYLQRCHGKEQWRTLAIESKSYDPKEEISARYKIPNPDHIIVHSITLLPQVEISSTPPGIPNRRLLLVYDSKLQFWYFDPQDRQG